MLSTALITSLLSASLALSAPIHRRVTIDQAATAEAQQRDNTATRAFTGAQIKTSDGQCLTIDPNSGDFRENLIPVQIQACSGSANQQWDFITAGKHNDQAGNALIVSTLMNGCLNFDPRRAAGNQVLLFSCGGRADGEGKVTDSQLFPFDGKSTGPLSLVPKNSNNAVCLTVKGKALDQAACNPADANAQQLFTIEEKAGQQAPAPATSVAASTSATQTSAQTATSAGTASKPTGTTKLDQAAVAEAQQRDNTATRAFSSVEVKTSDGQCLSVDAQSGDFRENLIPITTNACDGSDGQKWDVITKGKHNNVNGAALVVSALTQGCLNFDPRRAAGNQVLLFSCGGRADGEGQVTDSQLFTFDGSAGPITLAPQNGKNAVCLTPKNGLLDQAACSNGDKAQLFTFGTGAAGQAAPPPEQAITTSASASATATQAPSTTVNASKPTGTTKLDQAAVAEAQQKDDTATRALSSVQIKTSDGQCLSVDAQSGDFRENLIPITTNACDGSAGQKWDVITKGKHNNVDGAALIVSALTQGCLNFDGRRAAGNQVLLFSCGGRADGEGQVTDSQLFPFDGKTNSVTIAPQNGKNAVCFAPKNGLLDQEACASGNKEQLFSFVA